MINAFEGIDRSYYVVHFTSVNYFIFSRIECSSETANWIKNRSIKILVSRHMCFYTCLLHYYELTRHSSIAHPTIRVLSILSVSDIWICCGLLITLCHDKICLHKFALSHSLECKKRRAYNLKVEGDLPSNFTWTERTNIYIIHYFYLSSWTEKNWRLFAAFFSFEEFCLASTLFLVQPYSWVLRATYTLAIFSPPNKCSS